MREIATAIWVLALVTALLVFYIIVKCAEYHPEKHVLAAYELLRGLVKEKERKSAWHRRSEEFLRRNGAAFHYGSRIDPIRFLVLRILLAMAGLLIGAGVSLIYGMLGAVVLFFLPGGLLRYLNKQDNLKLLPEIKLVYHALELQIRAGVYVMDALTECYGSVQNKRLQNALLDMAGDIVMKADIYSAMESFQGSFDNRYIDSLCITVLQASESGQAIDLLNDIGEQLKDMESEVMSRRKSKLDRSITFYQLGILGAVMAVIIYACIEHMFSTAVKF